MRKGSKTVDPVSQICGTLKNPSFPPSLTEGFALEGFVALQRATTLVGTAWAPPWSWRRKLTGAAQKGPCNTGLSAYGATRSHANLSIYSLSTSALGGGGWSAPRPGRFTPGKDPVPIVQEVGWALGPVWTCAKNLAPTGIRSPDRPARSQSLQPTELPGPHKLCDTFVNLSRVCLFLPPWYCGCNVTGYGSSNGASLSLSEEAQCIEPLGRTPLQRTPERYVK
jgi:hypothetical protein